MQRSSSSTRDANTDENRKLVAPSRVTPPTFDAVVNFSRAKGKLDWIFRDQCSAWPARIEATPRLQMHPGGAGAVGVEGGARIEALGLPLGEELLYLLGSDMPGIGLGGREFREEFEDELVFLVGERLPKVSISFRKFSTAFVSGSASSSLSRPDISSPLSLASSSRRFRFCASKASAGGSPVASRKRRPFARHSIR